MARIKHVTLDADTLTTVELDADVRRVEVLNRDGAGEIYYRVDPPPGFDFDLEDDDIDVLPACMNAESKRSRATGTTKIALRASVATKITVRDADNDD